MNTTDFDPIESLNFLTNRVGRLLASRLKVLLGRADFELPTQCASILADLWKQDGLNQQELAIAAIKDKATILLGESSYNLLIVNKAIFYFFI